MFVRFSLPFRRGITRQSKGFPVFLVNFSAILPMRQTLHTYKLRLTNLSQGNRSLKLARLSSRRDMDLLDLGHLENDTAESILAKLIAGKDVRLINRLDPRLERVNLADRRLSQIHRTAETLFEETGTYDLFVGYPFVEGKFIDGTVARCPVLLFPVRLTRNLRQRPRWQLQVIRDEPVVFNQTFFLAYEQFQQVRLPEAFWEEEIDPSADWQAWLNAFYEKCKAYEIDLNFNSRLFEQKLIPFTDYLKETMERFPVGKLTFQPQAVLGIFPQSDSALLQDYQAIERDPEAFEMGRFFRINEQPEIVAQPIPTQEKYIPEEQRYFVTDVDDSQEQALLRIKAGSSQVIHGPPGTGKSQVIVNIIADAMAHGKKVLLVSQKRAALDVVYKRLSGLGLGRFAVLVHDYRHDRKAIYDKIRSQIDDIEAFHRENRDLNLTRWEHDYKLLSRDADRMTRLYDELYAGLTQPQPCGLSVHELYLRADATLATLPLETAARQLDHGQSLAFLQKLRAVLDYRDFFDEAYPWRDRLSFRHHRFEDKKHLLEKLAAIPDELSALNGTYQKLRDLLSTRILDAKLSQQRIAAFRQANQAFQDAATREDLEHIHRAKAKVSPEAIASILDKIEQALTKLEKRRLLDDEHWKFFDSLGQHSKAYDQLHKKTFRFLSVAFLRARWFLGKILESRGLELNETSFKELKREIRLFQALHRLYTRYHDHPFFEDLPLFNPQADKWEWLEIKREHLKAYTQVMAITYFRKIKPRFAHGEWDRAAWETSMRSIDRLEAFNQQLLDAERGWNTFLHLAQIAPLREGIKDPGIPRPWLASLSEALSRDYEELCDVDRMLAGFEVGELQALEAIRDQISASVDADALVLQVENSLYFYWLEMAEQRTPVLAEVSTRGWQRKMDEYGQKLRDRRSQVAELIQRKLKEQITGIIEYNRLKNPVTYRTIHHQVSKKRRVWSVRKLVQETWQDGLSQLVPVWMASPESVAAVFPMQRDFFDVVIFDEASQCFVERAIPVILRGKQCVIAGDDKQLRPLDLYLVKHEEAEAEFVENEMALEVESILDLAKTTFEESPLTWHYRSREEELINFSNHAFYGGKLQVIPPATHDPLNQPPLEWIAVQGQWRNNINRPEAERVIALLLELVQRPDQPSIGIVTFNFHQQELIKDLLDEHIEALATENESRYQQLQAAMHRTENEEFQGLFVKNIENVQGDERDIIVFSVGYGHNENGVLSTNFGLLNQDGGENRLNVAISRARRKVYVVCSFQPGELKVETAKNPGPRFFKHYLQYVKAVSDGRHVDAFNLLNQQSEQDLTAQAANPVADFFAARLEAASYTVLRNVGDTAYKLDLAVKAAPDADHFLLGIECEGSHYFSGNSSKEREVYRRALLLDRGWQLHRVWARNFWKDREKEVEKVLGMLGKRGGGES